MLQQFLKLLPVMILALTICWCAIAEFMAKEIALRTNTAEVAYRLIKRLKEKNQPFDEKFSVEAKNGIHKIKMEFYDFPDAIQKIDELISKTLKDYQRFNKFVPFKKVRVAASKRKEELEEIRDKLKELQEKL